MVLTDGGSFIEVIFLFELNAFLPIVVTPSGITVFSAPNTSVPVAVSMMALQSLRLS